MGGQTQALASAEEARQARWVKTAEADGRCCLREYPSLSREGVQYPPMRSMFRQGQLGPECYR